MSDVKLGKQRVEIDWDTDEIVDLDPYIKRILERLDMAERKLAGHGVWVEYEAIAEGMPPAIVSGSGVLPLHLEAAADVRYIKWECRVVRKNVS